MPLCVAFSSGLSFCKPFLMRVFLCVSTLMSRPASRSLCCCLLLLVLYCACFQQLLSSSGRVQGQDESSSVLCNSSNLSQCANLGSNPPYPFGGSAACAASPSYVLSNCTPSSPQAYWDSFSDAAMGVVGPPAVTAVTYELQILGDAVDPSYSGYITFKLSWNKSLADLDSCPPLFSSSNLSLYNIPSSINLARFHGSSALSFSDDNTILLFNCARKQRKVAADTDQSTDTWGCLYYKALCEHLASTPCIEWVIPSSTRALMLKDELENLACPHFMFGILSVDQFQTYTMFSPAVLKLLWTDMQCVECQNANGICIFEAASSRKFRHCECDNGSRIDFNTQICYSDVEDDYVEAENCYGGQLECANTRVKVGVGVAVGIVGLLGICVLIYIFIKVGLPALISFLRKVQSVAVPVVINILKKILRKLQSVNPGHGRFLDLLADLDGLTERPTEYSYGSLASATKSFSSLVGEGGFGTVYKGTITTQDSKSHGGGSEQQIAVKVLEAKSKHSKKQFVNEVVTIGKIHHVNVVRLLGFCMQEDHEMLVYEYVVNGSLDKWLFNKKGKPQEHVLDWGQRCTIALGVARGLSYLHEECRHRTVHCDIKPQNILLDAEMHPKIADFGLARLMSRDESKVVTFARGTPGYMAPEFWRGGESQLSTKFDVYSYGMVLLELISGHRNFEALVIADDNSFPGMAFKAVMEGDLESIVDPRLNIMSDVDEARKEVEWKQIKTATLIALWCIQDNPARRPQMSEVVKYLEGGATVSESPPQPAISISFTSSPQQELSLNNIGSHHESECTPLSVGR